jgi:hypothetical protein
MTNRTKLALTTMLGLSLTLGCQTQSKHPASPMPVPTTKAVENPSQLPLLTSYLTGHFSSLEQSKQDMSYFDIHLHAAPIWQDRNDGPWIYIEQARGDALDQPYRQRVYRLGQEGDTYTSVVYELPGTPDEVVEKFAGAWRDESKLAGVTPQQLKERPGCTVYLTHKDGVFEGGTEGNGCLSSLRGATYATSKVHADTTGLKTWDQGFDAKGKQVWGATKGPYHFDRVGQ